MLTERSRCEESLLEGRCIQNGAGAWTACWGAEMHTGLHPSGDQVTWPQGAAPEKEELGEPTADTLSKT